MELLHIMWGFLFFLIGINSVFCIDHTYFFRRDNSLVAPFSSSWTPVGNAFVTPNFVRLTGDSKGSRGAIYNNHPLISTDWEVQIAFKVHGSTGSMFGDGFAFWLVHDKGLLGKAFGGPENFRGLAVFFDTYKNNPDKSSFVFPYISAMVSNGSLTFDHDHDGINTHLAGCHFDFRNMPLGNIVAIKYSRNTLNVSLDLNSRGVWKHCFQIDGVHLPTEYYLGLSAATGDLTDTHDIQFLKTFELEVGRTAEEMLTDWSRVEPHVERADELFKRQSDAAIDAGWSFWNVLFLIICFLLIFGLMLWAYSIYQSQKKRGRRLY